MNSRRNDYSVGPGPSKRKWFDLFVGFNLVLFLGMCLLVYYARFAAYRGSAHLPEFLAYALLITTAIAAAWLWFRWLDFDFWLLALAELGILMHFAGGMALIDGVRLYDHFFFDLRFDKYVHFYNSFTAALVVRHIVQALDLQLRGAENFAILLIVLGLGTTIEIFEYGVTRSIPLNGVGGYDNNLQDLIANLCGGLCYWSVFGLVIPRLRAGLSSTRTLRPEP